jgi:futalosine hydrolase
VTKHGAVFNCKNIKKNMRILIVAATEPEISKLKEDTRFAIFDCDQSTHSTTELKQACEKVDISFLVTGAGMVATAYALGKHVAQNQYDLAINLGIAGSFDRNISLGEVVEIIQDTFAELGAEDDEAFITIDQLGFGEGVFQSTYQLPASLNIKKATAITVNTVHGNEASIQKVSNRINAQIESMEGAAFFYACKQAGVPSVQIRAVSNYVEKRNRDAWQIGLAVKNLNTFAVEFLSSL